MTQPGRVRTDWAEQITELEDVDFPTAERMVVVMDILNPHGPASLDEGRPPPDATRLADTLEIHYTPAHGRWLNLAAIALRVLSRPSLDQRVPNMETLAAAVAVWEARRKVAGGRIAWHLTTDDARITRTTRYLAMHVEHRTRG